VNKSRESISVALFNLLNVTGVKSLVSSFSRVTSLFTDFTESDQPALLLVKGGEQTELASQANSFALTKWTLNYKLILYARRDSAPGIVGETLMNSIMDAVETAMQSVPKGVPQTLGGLVTSAWIEGGQSWDLGLPEDPQMVLVATIRVVTGI
jgi:hypothetical protein